MTSATEGETAPHEHLHFAAGTHIGRRREENQDAFGILKGDGFHCFIVADGMGGVRGGALASSLAIRAFESELSTAATFDEEIIRRAVKEANQTIFSRGLSDSEVQGMGTTLVGLGFAGESLITFNIGDSRVYRVRNGVVERLTQDHTLVQELLRSGAISAAQADHSPVSHMLTRSLGPTADVEVDCVRCADGPARGDIYLACSDGLYNFMSDRELKDIVEGYRLDDAMEQLIELANRKGGTDNITAILIEVDQQFPRGLEDFVETRSFVLNQDAPSVRADLVGSGKSAPEAEAPPEIEHENPAIRMRMQFQGSGSGIHEIPVRQFAEGDSKSPIADDRAHRVRLISLLFAFFGGGIAAALYFFSSPPAVTDAPQITVARAGDVPLEISQRSVERSAPVGAVTSTVNAGEKTAAGVTETAPDPVRFSVPAEDQVRERMRTDRERVERRKVVLEGVLLKLGERLASFDKPIDGTLSQALVAAEKQREANEKRAAALRDEVDSETRKLTVWHGRRKRLEDSDIANMATEVAGSSAEVNARKLEFEAATWEYLRALETSRFNPADQAQQETVAALVQKRNEKLTILGEAVTQLIIRSVAEINDRISELTLERDQLLAEQEVLDRDRESIRAILGNNPVDRARRRKELEDHRATAENELREIEKVLSPTRPEESAASQ